MFPERELGILIFDCLEDTRVDAQMLARYRGVAAAYRRLSKQVIAERPRLGVLPLREAFLEGLVQASLGGDPFRQAPMGIQTDLRRAIDILSRLETPIASVEDSAEAALRIYQIASRLLNTLTYEDDHHSKRRCQPRDDDKTPEKMDDLVRDPDEISFSLPQEVEFLR